MNTFLRLSGAIPVLALLFSFSVLGTPRLAQAADDMMAAGAGVASSQDIQRANDLIGLDVRNGHGDKVGTVSDIIFNPGDNRIRYAEVAYGGFLWMDRAHAAVPWTSLRLSAAGAEPSDRHFTISGDLSGFLGAGTYTDIIGWSVHSISLPAVASESGLTQSAVSDRDTTAEPTTADEYVYGNHIYARPWNRSLDNPDRIGKVVDVAVDVSRGEVLYALVSLHGDRVRDVNGKWVALPWSALSLDRPDKTVVASASVDDLRQFAFNPDQMPNLGDPAYATLLNGAFGGSEWQVLGYVGDRNSTDRFGRYDADRVTTLTGSVIADSADVLRLAGGLGHVSLRTADGGTYLVILAPQNYVEKEGLAFHPGDQVTITGSEQRDVGAHRILLAGRIEANDRVTVLRDAAGAPVWMPGSMGMPD